MVQIEPGGERLGVLALQFLIDADIEMQRGLTETEFAHIEAEFDIEFPDDLRSLLASGLPMRDRILDTDPDRATIFGFPDWRSGDPEQLRIQIELPITALLQDVEHGHWPDGWGERPSSPAEAIGTARQHMAHAPRLVPVYAHRYLPPGRGTWGHPVLSVLGTDVVYYGADLVDYLRHEFNSDEEADSMDGDHEPSAVTVAFWKNFL